MTTRRTSPGRLRRAGCCGVDSRDRPAGLAPTPDDGVMVIFQQWCVRLAAVVTAVLASVLVPVAAYASSGPGSVMVEAARRRPRGVGGVFGALCCLVVVGAIVVVLLLVMRNRRSGPRR